jgi:hypothetical protein
MIKTTIKRTFILTVAAVLLIGTLSACMADNTADQPAPSATENFDRANNPINTSDSATSPPVNNFSVSADWQDSQGYSGAVTLTAWTGVQGNGEAMTHPADAGVVIPAAKNTVCVIPFQITVLNTTESADFTSNITYTVSGVQPTGADRSAVMDSYNRHHA